MSHARPFLARFALWLPLAVFAVIALVAAAIVVEPDKDGLFVGHQRPAPRLTLPGLDGGEVSVPGPLVTSGESVVVVNYWASWCAPCALEHPALMHMSALGVTILGVAYKDGARAATDYLARNGNPYERVGLDANGDAGLAFGIAGVPETFVVDASGAIVFAHRGPLDTEALVRLDDVLPQSLIPEQP